MEITLKKPEIKTLAVNIGNDKVSIPLGSSLTIEEFASLSTFEGTIAFFNKYIPKEVAKNLTFDEYNQITIAWQEATKNNGVDSGE